MIITKEIAQKVLNVLNKSEEDFDYCDEFKKEFDDDSIWYILYLASTWYNDLQDWCEAIINDSLDEFFDVTDLKPCEVCEEYGTD